MIISSIEQKNSYKAYNILNQLRSICFDIFYCIEYIHFPFGFQFIIANTQRTKYSAPTHSISVEKVKGYNYNNVRSKSLMNSNISLKLLTYLDITHTGRRLSYWYLQMSSSNSIMAVGTWGSIWESGQHLTCIVLTVFTVSSCDEAIVWRETSVYLTNHVIKN